MSYILLYGSYLGPNALHYLFQIHYWYPTLETIPITY